MGSCIERPADPIAIVGIGCRFPGARGVREFWDLLSRGGDAVTVVPASRFDVDALFDARPGVPGKLISRWGGFIDGVDLFDAEFFGVSPREARCMDPQHRLALEVAWEALDDGGQIPARLRGSSTGVFLGIHRDEYASLSRPDPSELDLALVTGELP